MAHLVIVDGEQAGDRIGLDSKRLVIGRGAEADLTLADGAVSRQHCALVFGERGWEVSDLGATNGTRLNGRPVARGTLADGDEIGLGHSLILFVDPEEASSALAVEGRTRLSDDGPGTRWRAQQLDELLALGERVAAADGTQAMLEEVCGWLEQTLLASAVRVRRRHSERWVTVFASGSMAVTAEVETEARRAMAHGDVRWLERSRVVCAALSAPEQAYVLLAHVVAGDPSPTRWELRLMAGVARMVGASLRPDRSPTKARAELPPLDRTESPRLRAAVELLDRAASSDATVLLRGESGTGKELAARWLHERGRRALRPFIAVNCGALPETLIESELFGHEAGAFTGADARHAGRFERAHLGTLFLDEVGELSLAAQTRLLRVLETQTVERVGGTEPIQVDARIVAATHRDLAAMVQEGAFREDLYYRFAVLLVTLPPLRERREDIPSLAERFLRDGDGERQRPLTGFSGEAMAALEGHRWPGNVRELENAVAHASVVALGPHVERSDLPPHVLRPTEEAPESSAGGARGLRLPASLRDVERAAVVAALTEAEGNKSQAARTLGINRATLYAKLELHGIES